LARGDPLGKIALLVMIFALFYDTLFALFKFSATTISNMFRSLTGEVDNLIISWGGGEPVFPTTEALLTTIFSWEYFLFTNAMALALLISIDIIRGAFKV